MGGFPWGILGYNANPTDLLNMEGVPIRDMRVGLELAGAAYKELLVLCRDPKRAETLSRHNHGEPLVDGAVVYGAAAGVVDQVIALATVASHVYGIGEGTCPNKRYEKRRESRAKATHEKKEYKGASGVQDCVVELIRQGVAKLSNELWFDN